MSSPKEYYIWYNKHYYSRHLKKEKWRIEDYQYELKQIAFFIYSNGTMKCAECGFDDFDCLELDHINNDGYKHRHENKNHVKNPYLYIKKLGYPDEYQVLCKNCNWIKHLKYLDEKKRIGG